VSKDVISKTLNAFSETEKPEMEKFLCQEWNFDKFMTEHLLRKNRSFPGFETGLPDFSWSKIPKRGKIYQITTKYTK
jgi:hypothetical protein